MELLAPAAVPDPQVCEQARITRDPRFDGWFFTAVTSTRIYCRPVCPVPTVNQANVRYYASAAAAEAEGFRPCLICRPELAPGAWRRGEITGSAVDHTGATVPFVARPVGRQGNP